jgi:putative redox protein
MVGAAAAARIMADVTPAPPIAELVWSHELRFDATAKSHTFPVDSDSAEGPSPTQLLAVSLAACMAMDIVDILRKGRHPLRSFSCTVGGQRKPTPPKRFTAFTLHCRIGGAVPETAVARAAELSREKYCSVWHSLREDITLTTTFDIQP